jgi:hypothetical protein
MEQRGWVDVQRTLRWRADGGRLGVRFFMDTHPTQSSPRLLLAGIVAGLPLIWASVSGVWTEPIWAAVPLLAALLLCWLCRSLVFSDRVLQGLARVAPLVGFALAAWLSARVPISVDGELYWFQAKLFSAGQLTSDAWVDSAFFHYYFLVPLGDGSVASAFPPGWPLVLGLGHSWGLAWIVNPLLVALLVILTGRLARAVFPSQPAVETLSCWLVALSPFVTHQGGSMLSHPFAAVLTVAALWLALRPDRHRWWMPIGMGLLIGALMTVRPLNGAVTGLVVAGLVLARAPRPPWWSMAQGLVLAIMLGAAYLATNMVVTGDPWTPGQNQYIGLTEPNPDCHRLGFGEDVGCVYAHNLESPGFGPMDALGITGTRLASLGTTGLGPGLALLLPLLFLWRRPKESVWPLVLLPLALLGAYGLFYFHGNFLGPRLLFEAFLPLVVLIAAAACSLRWVGVAVVLGGLLGGHALLTLEKDNAQWLPIDEVAEKVASAPGARKLIFVSMEGLQPRARWTHYSLGMILGDAPTRNAPLVFAHDLGDAANQALLNSVENRMVYRLRLTIDPSSVQSYRARLVPTLVPYAPPALPVHTVSLLGRFPLPERSDCGFAQPVALPSGEHVLRLTTRGDGPCAFALGRVQVPDGEWTVALEAFPSPKSGDWSLQTGGGTVIGTASLAGDEASARSFELGVIASKGPQTVRLVGHGVADLRAIRLLPRERPAPGTE